MGCGGSIPDTDTISYNLDSNDQIKPKEYPSYPLRRNSHWLNPQFHDKHRTQIIRPDELDFNLEPCPESDNQNLLDRVRGSLIGLALGDALGAHVEFRPRQYLLEHPVKDLEEGGTWGLKKGQFTDDTSMALCLAISLIVSKGFSPYDQLVRYKWWYRYGYMSSTGQCFDIGAATRNALVEFEQRQKSFADKRGISFEDMDFLSDKDPSKEFNVFCSDPKAAGNGGLMRLAPVPLFFHRDPPRAVKYSGISTKITHGDTRAYDACRYYGALIVAALRGATKEELLDENFYNKHRAWFGDVPLDKEILAIAQGSYKKEKGYDDGIRGKGFVVHSLEAALWAFCYDGGSFEKGALAAVNLGDDTDTTAAIYGQLAGAYYGYGKLPKKWLKYVYAGPFITYLSQGIVSEGEKCSGNNDSALINSPLSPQKHVDVPILTSVSGVHLQDNHHTNDKIPNAENNHSPAPKRAKKKA